MKTKYLTDFEMNTYTFDENTISDLHKDAYGFRPREQFWRNWEAFTDAQKQSEWDYLIEVMEQSCAQEKLREEQAVVDFEALVEQTIANGATDRACAIDWFHQAEETNGDVDYLAYKFGLPYKYFQKLEMK